MGGEGIHARSLKHMPTIATNITLRNRALRSKDINDIRNNSKILTNISRIIN